MNKTRKIDLINGESADTLKGILNYAKKYRPAIIILENVQGAPWKTLEAVWQNSQSYFEDKVAQFDNVWEQGDPAYVTRHVIVNSKDFYIPQTRNRGYMVLFDKTRCDELKLDAQKMLDDWELAFTGELGIEKVKNSPGFLPKAKRTRTDLNLKRPVSSSLEDFVLQNDDPRILHQRAESTINPPGEQKARRDIAWTSCQSRYEQYRIDKRLGVGHPITKWSVGGKCIIPDYMWRRWMASKVDRIKDTFEICALRVVRIHGYDGFWKSSVHPMNPFLFCSSKLTYNRRCWELSQNVDRWQDASNLGIISCITPTGEQFLTSRGGPVTGLELLMLQAIPVDSISLSRETDRELQDLAGNAMTSTVVGAAVLCALKVGVDLLQAVREDKPDASKMSRG